MPGVELGPRTDVVCPNSDPLAVGLVGDTVDLLDVVRVRDDLVTSDDVLCVNQYRRNGAVRRVMVTRAQRLRRGNGRTGVHKDGPCK